MRRGFQPIFADFTIRVDLLNVAILSFSALRLSRVSQGRYLACSSLWERFRQSLATWWALLRAYAAVLHFAADVDRELRASYEAMETHLSQRAMPLAFPFGSYSDAVIAMARRLPYTCALTTDAGTNGPATDLFLLRRNLIGDDDDEAAFVARVSGLTAALQRVLAPFRN